MKPLALLALALLAACGADAPTAPKANPCVLVDTLWVDGKPVATLTAYYTPPCPAQRKP